MVAPIHAASGLPPCEQRPTHVDPPWANGDLWCLEQVINDDSTGELGFTALTAAPDGTLFVARPLSGQIMALTDSNGDGLPDTAHKMADGLTLPNGLVYFEGALYISGGSKIYRLRGAKLETLVKDLPAGTGFWTGGLTIGPDKRMYIAIGAPCDFCISDDPARGSILSFALDGSDRQIVATGLRQPGDVAFRKDVLWTLDSARDALSTPDLDELNRVTPGAHFGWPYCFGRDNQRDTIAGDFDCGKATAPALTFPTHSTPLRLTAYTSDTFPGIKGDLLVTLNGSSNQADVSGFTLVAIRFDNGDKPEAYRIIIPEQSYSPFMLPLQYVHMWGSGFWPHRPIDVTVSAEGWIYISVGGGRILALRPR